MSKTLRPRSGFTLIELLVVIAIIGVLTALTAAAVMAVRGRGIVLQATTDISQMAASCKAFKAKYNIYPPSRLKLSTNVSDYSTPAFQETTGYLTTMFPKIDLASFAASYKAIRGNTDGTEDLQGDQCLVLFLAGPPSGGSLVGFSSNPRNPFDFTSQDRTKFFEFQQGRLVNAVSSSPFPSYKDSWGTNVYAYFSSGRRANGYVSTPSDCSRVGIANGPYFTAAGPPRVYANSGTFQILCAGPNGQFGAGGQINLGSGNSLGVGDDDYSNFTSGQLSSGQ